MLRHFHSFLVVIALAIASCSTDLAAPGDARITCATSSDCPGGWLCATASLECVETSNTDTEGPSLQAVVVVDVDTIVASFDQELAPTNATLLTSYSITDLRIDAVELLDRQRVRITTAAQSPGAAYVLHATGVTDAWGNPPVQSDGAFTGFGVGADPTPPEILSPRNDERVLEADVRLVWSSRLRAARYTVEVARDAAFTDLVVPPITIESKDASVPPDTSTVVQIDEPIRVYWRVRADVTTPTTYGEGHFDRLDGAVLVFCDTGEVCDDALLAGNRSAPVRSVRAGLILAQVLGLSEVHIAQRPDDAPYVGQVQLASGIDLLGGFDATFATRDLDALRPTLVGTFGIGIFATNLFEPTLLEGLHVIGPEEDLSDSVALVVFDTGANLTVRSCELYGGEVHAGRSSGATSAGVDIRATNDDDTHTPLFTDNVLAGGDSLVGMFNTSSVGVQTARSSPILSGNISIRGGAAKSVSHGIDMNAGTIVIDGNTEVLGGWAPNSRGLYLSGREAVITDNGLIAGASRGAEIGLGATVGVQLSVTDATIEDTVIRGADGLLKQGGWLRTTGLSASSGTIRIARSTVSAGTVTLDTPSITTPVLETYALSLNNADVVIESSTLRGVDVALASTVPDSAQFGVMIQSGSLSVTDTRLEMPASGAAALYGIVYNRGLTYIPEFAVVPIVLTDTTVVLGDLDAPSPGVTSARGIYSAKRYSTSSSEPDEVFDGLTIELGDMPNATLRTGLDIESPHGSMTNSSVTLFGAARDRSFAMRVTTPNMTFGPAADKWTFTMTSSTFYGGSADLTTGITTALEVPTRSAYTGRWTLLAANNTFLAGPASVSSAVRFDVTTGTDNAFFFANNLFAVTAAAPCLRMASGSFTSVVERLGTNGFAGCADAACDGACVDAAGLDALDGAGGAFDGSVELSLADVGFEDSPMSLALSDTTKAALCNGGVSLASPGLCTPAPVRCAVVTEDYEGATRAAPYALGAYERDVCAP